MIEVPELQYMPYKDGQIAFRESGAGPAIFLLHGMNGDSRSWAYLFHSLNACLLYTSPSPRDGLLSRMPSSA